MSPTITKAIAGICSVGAIGGAGVTANYFLSGESIRAYIERTKSSTNKVFLTSTGLNLTDIKAKYTENTKKTKPKDSKNKEVTAEELEQWCKDNVDSKFSSDKDSLYQNILSWCFVNPKTIEQELVSKKREILSSQDANGDDWKVAWDNYNKDKNISKRIVVETSDKDLNGADRVKGGQALHKWCTAKKTEPKKLYEENIEEIYELFETWCTKEKV